MAKGGKGQSTTTEVELPPELDAAAGEVLGAAFNAASLPYKPNRGVTIASFAPQEKAAIRGASTMAAAFGLSPGTGHNNFGMADDTKGPLGVRGYSTGSTYDAMRKSSMSEDDVQERNVLLSNMRTAASEIYSKGSSPNAGLATRKRK